MRIRGRGSDLQGIESFSGIPIGNVGQMIKCSGCDLEWKSSEASLLIFEGTFQKSLQALGIQGSQFEDL